jgi:DNA polymerase alpha-associated DNA helicase A
MENALKQLKKMITTPSQSEKVVCSSHVLKSIIFSNFNSKEVPRWSRLTEVLLGMAMPSRRTLSHDISFFDDSLNDSQMAAVRFALESVEFACIHGPPGDGV